MNSKDKTGDKLVASIRKSKSGTVASKNQQRPDADESAAEPNTTIAEPAIIEKNQDRKINFSLSRRVWPD